MSEGYYIRRDESKAQKRPRMFWTGDDFSAYSGHIHYFPTREAAVTKAVQLKERHNIGALRIGFSKRRKNPRKSVMRGKGMFRLIAKRGNTRLVYIGGGKFSRRGEPVYFRSMKSAEMTARWLLRTFTGLENFTFHAVSN